MQFHLGREEGKKEVIQKKGCRKKKKLGRLRCPKLLKEGATEQGHSAGFLEKERLPLLGAYQKVRGNQLFKKVKNHPLRGGSMEYQKKKKKKNGNN